MKTLDHEWLARSRLVPLFLLLVPFGLPYSGFAATWHVSPGGNDGLGDGSANSPWRGIGHAIDNASAGDTIKLMDDGDEATDDYVENVVVDRALTIEPFDVEGANPQVKGLNESASVFRVTADNVTIRGLDIYGATNRSDYFAAIHLVGVTGCTLENNRCGWDEEHANQMGIYLNGAPDNSILNNTCSHASYYGIRLQGACDRTQLAGNQCFNDRYNGIASEGGSELILDGNTCRDGGGIYLTAGTNSATIINNNCSACTGYGMEIRGIGHVIEANICDENDDYGISITSGTDGFTVQDNLCRNNRMDGINAGGTNHQITGNTCSGSTERNGIFFWGSGSAISANECTGNKLSGILIRTGDANTISLNTCDDNVTGILLEDSGNCVVSENSCIDNNFRGIALDNAQNNEVLDNICTHNRGAAGLFMPANIFLGQSTDNTVSGNVCSDALTGIYLHDSSNNNTISNNTVQDHQTGIYLFDSNGNLISANTGEGSEYGGIQLNKAGGNTITDNDTDGITLHSGSENNTVSNNRSGDSLYYLEESNFNSLSGNACGAISFRDAASNTLTGNSMSDGGFRIWGDLPEHWSTHTADATNTVDGKPLRFWTGVNGGTVPAGSGQVVLGGCTNVTVENQDLSDCVIGLQLGYCSGIKVLNNTCDNNGFWGIYVVGSNDCTFSGNVCTSYYSGIVLENSGNNSLVGNTCNDHTGEGISLSESSGNTLSGNTCNNNQRSGIWVVSSDTVSLLNNMCSGNRDGIVVNASDDAILTGNILDANYEDGLSIAASVDANCTGNVMTDNGINMDGEQLENWVSHQIGTSNTVNGKPVRYLVNQDGGSVPSGAGQVILANCTDVTVENQDLTHGSVGVLLGASSGNRILNNNCSGNNFAGVQICFGSNDNEVSGNTCNQCYRGIVMYESGAGVFTNNTCNENDTTGIFLWLADGCTFTGNTCNGNTEDGIHLAEAGEATFANNVCRDNKRAGIFWDGSTANTLAGTTFVNDGLYLRGWEEEHWNTHAIDADNRVNGKPITYWVNRISETVPRGAGQVILVNCTDVVVELQDLSNASVGVTLAYGSGNIIRNNKANGNTVGISLSYLTSGNIIQNNFCCDGTTGIGTWVSWWNTIANNTCNQNSEYGINLDSNSNTISGNSFNGNLYGAFLYHESDSVLDGNTFVGNTTAGIYLYYSKENTIARNFISDNETGLFFYGNCYDHVIHRNTFTDNNESLSHTDARNRWNTPEPVTYYHDGAAYTGYLGNFYDDYAGIDANGDGVGDTGILYPLSGDMEAYPLMAPAAQYTDRPPCLPLEILPDSGTGYLQFSFTRFPSREHYRVETSLDLHDWQLFMNLVVTEPTGSFSHQLDGGGPRRYYRVIVE